jgi:hypothetical protein
VKASVGSRDVRISALKPGDPCEEGRGAGVWSGTVGIWGVASFENDPAAEWFLGVEEASDPGAIMAQAIDDALSVPEDPSLEVCCEAIAAAELCACCAGQWPDRMPDNVRYWAESNPHGPHGDEVALAVQAVCRVRDESDLRAFWDQSGDHAQWLLAVDDLGDRLHHSSAGSPPYVSP